MYKLKYILDNIAYGRNPFIIIYKLKYILNIERMQS
jgi:hypothetical protein